MDLRRISCEEDEGRWRCRRLCRIQDLRALTAAMRRLLTGNRLCHEAVQCASRNSQLTRIRRSNRCVQHLRRAQARQRRDGEDRCEIKEGGLATEQSHRRIKREAILLNKVPLVHHDDETLPRFNHRACYVQVLGLQAR